MSLRYEEHVATFRGKHNKLKGKILIYLLHCFKNDLGSKSAVELADATGVSLTSLQARLPLWTRWHYVNRRAVAGSRPHYAYSITDRGIHFVRDRIPDVYYGEYVQEINEHIRSGR